MMTAAADYDVLVYAGHAAEACPDLHEGELCPGWALMLRGLSIANLTRPAERISRSHNCRGAWTGLRSLPTARIAVSGILPVDRLIAEGHCRLWDRAYLGNPGG